MDTLFEIFGELLSRLLPLIVLLSFFGGIFGRKKKKGAEETEASNRRTTPTSQPSAEPSFDPFDEPTLRRPPKPMEAETPPNWQEWFGNEVEAPAPAPELPVITRRPPKPPRRKTLTAESTAAYDVDTRHAYDLDGDVQNDEAYRIDAKVHTDAYALSTGRDAALASGRELVTPEGLDRTAVRRAIVMREILDMPLGLRPRSDTRW